MSNSWVAKFKMFGGHHSEEFKEGYMDVTSLFVGRSNDSELSCYQLNFGLVV